MSDTAAHLGINRAGKGIFNKCEGTYKLSQENLIFFDEYRTSWYDRTKPYDIIYIIYKVYILPRVLYGLETLSLTKGQLEQLSKYHLQTIRNIQSLPQRTSTLAVLLLLGALPLEAELHRRRLSLAISIISSETPTIRMLVQRQLACSYDNRNSFFYKLAKILQKYKHPSLGQLFCSIFTKLKWKHMWTKAVNAF